MDISTCFRDHDLTNWHRGTLVTRSKPRQAETRPGVPSAPKAPGGAPCVRFPADIAPRANVRAGTPAHPGPAFGGVALRKNRRRERQPCASTAWASGLSDRKSPVRRMPPGRDCPPTAPRRQRAPRKRAGGDARGPGQFAPSARATGRKMQPDKVDSRTEPIALPPDTPGMHRWHRADPVFPRTCGDCSEPWSRLTPRRRFGLRAGNARGRRRYRSGRSGARPRRS